ncbi:putative membrane protein [Lipingzhangella halophila]|uniref:Putative membrane protein n=1 Tax=Lipingzhangella halophila TaxID=1783352 RepID=A0A7W7RDL0_9ACTN|nr:hypothetical protein [Lipingzhangella halophila]MBB4930036.1 putative membrane protein [Lipingzhangella halophila]
MFLLFILLTALAVYLAARAGRGGPPWAPRPAAPPEHEARKVLADRFARGDISVDEFLERASVLNWTPGSEAKGRK